MTNQPDLRDTIDRLISARIETRLNQLVEERLHALLGPSGEVQEVKKVTRVRETKPGSLQEYHGRILVRRIRVTDAHPRKRVEVLCKDCGEKSVLSDEAWKKGGCRCMAHTKVSPETAAKRSAPLTAFSEKAVAEVKSKLLKALKIGDDETLSALEWGNILGIDRRHLGRAMTKLAKANNEFVIQKVGKMWRVERRA